MNKKEALENTDMTVSKMIKILKEIEEIGGGDLKIIKNLTPSWKKDLNKYDNMCCPIECTNRTEEAWKHPYNLKDRLPYITHIEI